MITPDIEARHVRDFAGTLCNSPIYYIPVNPPGGSKENRCEGNVHAVVRKFGGEAIYGWHVAEWPGVYLTGRHHVVWRSPDGQIIDATPHGMGFTHIAFVDDETLRNGFCQIPSEVHCLVDDPMVQETLAVARKLEMDLIQSDPHAEIPTLDAELLSQLQALLSQLVAKYGPEPCGGPDPELLVPRAGGTHSESLL